MMLRYRIDTALAATLAEFDSFRMRAMQGDSRSRRHAKQLGRWRATECYTVIGIFLGRHLLFGLGYLPKRPRSQSAWAGDTWQ